MPIAHFTAAELPGTLAILIFGIAIGASVALRRTDSLSFALVGFCGLAAIGSVLDHFEGVGAAWKTAADVAFLLAALAVLVLLVKRSPATEGTARSR